MATRFVPVTAQKSAGQLMTGALWNAGPAALGTWLVSPPLFRGRQATAQTITPGTMTAMSLDATDVDTDGGHSNVTNNSRYTCQIAGWYWVEGYVAWQNAGTAALMETIIEKNGGFVSASAAFLYRQVDLQAAMAGALVQLAVGDYVEIKGLQNGGTIQTFVGTDLCPCLNVFWVRN